MPSGMPKDWTLDELELIWGFDVEDGRTVTEAARAIGVSHSHWYGMRNRLQNAGGPQVLFDQMQEAKKHRYNKASAGKARLPSRKPDTLQQALGRVYTIRATRAGRDGSYEQFTVTIPPLVAMPFIELYGQEVAWEPHEDGILLRPVNRVPMPALPAWLVNGNGGAE